MRTVPYYAAGAWTEIEDQCEAAFDAHDGDVENGLRSLGFRPWAEIGDSDAGLASIEVWARDDPDPRFVIFAAFSADILHVCAATLPDAMDLLAQWAPICQAASATSLLQKLNDSQMYELEDFVRRIDGALSGEPRRRP